MVKFALSTGRSSRGHISSGTELIKLRFVTVNYHCCCVMNGDNLFFLGKPYKFGQYRMTLALTKAYNIKFFV